MLKISGLALMAEQAVAGTDRLPSTAEGGLIVPDFDISTGAEQYCDNQPMASMKVHTSQSVREAIAGGERAEN